MQQQNLIELGIGGLFAIMILREVFGFLALRKIEPTQKDASFKLDNLTELVNRMNAKLRKIEDQTQDLHEWHDVADADGVKVWYVRKSLESTIDKLSENISTQTQVMQAMLAEIKDSKREMDRLQTAIKEVKDRVNH